MRVILASIVVAVILAVAAGFVLFSMQEPVYRSQPAQSVRIGDPGHNLVGPDWSGSASRLEDSERAVSATAREPG